MISIAMTSYNGEKYIKAQIDSILSQTIKDFELIICDDCSTDLTKEILQQYSKIDNRIKLFLNETNLGFKKNFEKAISFCSYNYIALSDQDDIWLPNHLELLQKIIGTADIACADAELIDENDKSLRLTLSQTDEFYHFENSDKLLYRILGKGNCFQGASMLIKKSFFDKALPIPDEVKYHDAWFAACACCGNGINYEFTPVTQYRQHSSQVTSNEHQEKSTFYLLKRFARMIFTRTKYETNKLCYIDNLKQRYDLSKDKQIILDNCNIIQLIRTKDFNFIKRLFSIHIFSKNYKYIYTRQDNKHKLVRILKNLF